MSYDHKDITTEYINAMAAKSVQKKMIFVADKNDQGPRQRWTFHKVQISLDGDFPLIGSGVSVLSVKGTVLADTTRPKGEEYFKMELIG